MFLDLGRLSEMGKSKSCQNPFGLMCVIVIDNRITFCHHERIVSLRKYGKREGGWIDNFTDSFEIKKTKIELTISIMRCPDAKLK